jgi:disease resistance protein RPM1
MVRRLALHGSITEHKSSIAKEHVRSFNAIGCPDSRTPLLLGFSVLRVLVIEECGSLEDHCLEHIGELVQLKYLGLVKTKVKLPGRIGHDLKFLEILDVTGGLIRELPPSVGELQNLRCLWADDGTRMKGEIGKLTCLEELQLYSVDECPNFFTELGKLTNLMVLKISYRECEEKALIESLCKLHKILNLKISSTGFKEGTSFLNTELAHVPVRSLEDLAPSSRLRRFFLQGIFIPRMPSWIDSMCVPLLSVLWLHLEVFEAQNLQALGRLPSLVLLFILSKEEKRISYTFSSAEFQKLKMLVTNVEISLGDGALTRLETLLYSASAARRESWVPWNNNCPLLTSVDCQLDCRNISRMEVMAMNAVLEKAGRSHPN